MKPIELIMVILMGLQTCLMFVVAINVAVRTNRHEQKTTEKTPILPPKKVRQKLTKTEQEQIAADLKRRKDALNYIDNYKPL